MKLRAGSRVVWIGTTIRQSARAATGWMRPWALASHSVTSSRARSITSVCGYSFIDTSTSALSTIAGVRCMCGSSSAPTTTRGPTMARTRASTSPSQSS